MKYAMQIIAVVLAFYAANKGKKEIIAATESGIVAWGRYRLDPVSGDRAANIVSVAKYIVLYSPWILVVMLGLYNYLDVTNG